MKDLDKGGFGKVEIWQNDSTRECVAVKRINIKNGQFRDDLISEMLISKKVKSKYIVQVKGSKLLPLRDGSFDALIFMEFCPGGTLSQLVRGPGDQQQELNDNVCHRFHKLFYSPSNLADFFENSCQYAVWLEVPT